MSQAEFRVRDHERRRCRPWLTEGGWPGTADRDAWWARCSLGYQAGPFETRAEAERALEEHAQRAGVG